MVFMASFVKFFAPDAFPTAPSREKGIIERKSFDKRTDALSSNESVRWRADDDLTLLSTDKLFL